LDFFGDFKGFLKPKT